LRRLCWAAVSRLFFNAEDVDDLAAAAWRRRALISWSSTFRSIMASARSRLSPFEDQWPPLSSAADQPCDGVFDSPGIPTKNKKKGQPFRLTQRRANPRDSRAGRKKPNRGPHSTALVPSHCYDNCWADDECWNALIYFPEPVSALSAAVWANKK
jgi:hypothetical protein